MDDQLLYENGKLRVTKNIFTNPGGERFVIANIKSIRDERKGRSAALMILGVACFAAAAFVHGFEYSQYILGGAGSLFVLLYAQQKESHEIYVHNAQGEVRVFRTKSADEFRDVSRALKKAISLHHQPMAVTHDDAMG
jgi:hypothetical protein